MKKFIVVGVILALLASVSIMVFADEPEYGYGCLLSEEDYEDMLDYKIEFVNDLVKKGDLSREEADKLIEELKDSPYKMTLRGLGFGYWMNQSDYADEFPARGFGRGCRGRRFE